MADTPPIPILTDVNEAAQKLCGIKSIIDSRISDLNRLKAERIELDADIHRREAYIKETQHRYNTTLEQMAKLATNHLLARNKVEEPPKIEEICEQVGRDS